VATKDGIGSVVCVSATTPVNAFERRVEWQAAVLVVALVVTGMTDRAGAPASARPPRSERRAGTAGGSPARRHVRPPRSC
jgi:hypothetical protein